MMKFLLPVILALFGTGAGIGAGIFLRPSGDAAAHADASHETDPHDAHAEDAHATDDHAASDHGGSDHGSSGHDSSGHGSSGHGDEPDYIKFPNQFVIPVVGKGKLQSMVVMTIALEADLASRSALLHKEPKFRDAFLKAMFDHASIGGFEGNFTEAEPMELLHQGLLSRAREIGGEGLHDVLILEITRQDV